MIPLTNLSLSNEQEKDKGVEISGLTNTRLCMSFKTLVSVLISIVGDTLKYPSYEKRDIVQHFSVYFEALGWQMEDYMITSAGTSLTILENLIPAENVLGMINPAIKPTLQRIDQLTTTVRR